MSKRDDSGREIQAGDLLRVYHFTARNQRKIYMHKLVFPVNENLELDAGGQYLYAVDVCDIQRKGSIREASKCSVSVIDSCEIIDGGTVKNDDLWWERRQKG